MSIDLPVRFRYKARMETNAPEGSSSTQSPANRDVPISGRFLAVLGRLEGDWTAEIGGKTITKEDLKAK